jgi:integrase
VVASAKAEVKHFRFHDLRHFHSTQASRAGVDLRSLMAHMGHTTVSTAMRYQHPRNDRMVADAMDAVMSAVEDAVTPPEAAASGTRMARGHLRLVQ